MRSGPERNYQVEAQGENVALSKRVVEESPELPILACERMQ